MKVILKALLKAVGVERVLLAVIDLGYAQLKKQTEKTDTKFDDIALESLVSILKDLAGKETVVVHSEYMNKNKLVSYIS